MVILRFECRSCGTSWVAAEEAAGPAPCPWCGQTETPRECESLPPDADPEDYL